MNKLVVLSGVPGSGKSYFCKTIKKLRPSHTYIVSSDELRAMICGSQNDLSQEDLVWSLFYKLADVWSNDKEGVVVLDATHISPSLRVDKTQDVAKKFDRVYLLMWNTPRDMVNNQNLQREFPLAPEVMDLFFDNFELPTKKDEEFFDKIILIEDNNLLSNAIKDLELDKKN